MNDSGSIVLGWLTKLALVLAVLGLLSYDGVSLVQTSFSCSDRANTIASDAADNYRYSKDVNKAYQLAVSEAGERDDTIRPEDFTVTGDGHVTLVLRREAQSLWMKHVGPLKKYLAVHATGTGAPPS